MAAQNEIWPGEAQLFRNVEIGFMTVAVVVYPILRWIISAPYGRHLNGRNWGPSIPGKFAWFSMEAPAFLAVVWFFVYGSPECTSNPANLALLALYVIHYIHRVLIFPWFLKTSPMPIFVWALAIVTNLCVTYMLGRHLGHYSQGYPETWLTSPQFVVGVLLFFGGMATNLHSDYALINLRKPGEKGYKIPRGGCFELISAANMFGEIIEWIGFGTAVWAASGWAWTLYVMGNLVPRAISHHHWYQGHFKDQYPKNRKAIIPFIY